MNSIKLLLTSLVLSGCSDLPPMPSIYQCQYNGNPRAFYCVNIKTKEKVKLSADDPKMKAAQCLSPGDYKKSEAWVQAVIEVAKTRCE